MNARALAVRVLPAPAKRQILRQRRRILDVVIANRIRSGRLGPLPSFLILGFGKCGTTELFDRLTEHPGVANSLTKEVNYFSHQYGRGIEWYRAHFSNALVGNGHGLPLAAGEASPGYACHPHAPGRVAQTIPNVKLIVLVRNPVARAYSQYQHQRRLGFEPLTSFEAAIAKEPDRVRGEAQRMEADPTYPGFPRYMYSYLSHGIYADHLPRWLNTFPRDQLKVVASEAFYRKPDETLRMITRYLDLPDWTPPTHHRHKSFAYPPMNPETRERLQDFFEPHNERLFALLGEDFGWNSHESDPARPVTTMTLQSAAHDD